MKLKVKIVSGLLCISYALGLIMPHDTHATVDPNDEPTSHFAPIPEEYSPREIELWCQQAQMELELMGSREKINPIRELIQTGQATMQIDAPNPDIPQDLVIDDPDYLLISNLGTALLAASLYYTVTNDHTLIEKLMQYIEINNVDVNRCEGTLLHMAIAQGKPCENFVLFLLEKRHANPNIKTAFDGSTALHAAVLSAQADMISILISHGADATITNNRGLTPYALADEPLANFGIANETLLTKEDRRMIDSIRNMTYVFIARGITK